MPSHPQDQIVAGEGADGHEARRAERELAGIAHQDVLAERDQRQDQPGNQDRAAASRRWRRTGARAPAMSSITAMPMRSCRKRQDLRVLRVAGAELAGFSVEHSTISSCRVVRRAG